MPAPRFGETDEEVQNEAQKSILRVFHALILSDFFGASALSVKGLHVDKKEPTAQNALSKTWPISRELYIFTNGEPQGDAKALVTYLLDPTKGQKNVAEVGYIPLGK